MQNVEGSDHEKRIAAELRWCFTYEEGKTGSCAGASGRKMRQICIWCENLKKREEEKNETGC